MDFYSVLGTQNTQKMQRKEQPDFYQDLNLDQILRKIQEYSPNYPVKELFYEFPTQEDILYRQDVYEDIRQQVIYDSFVKFSADMHRSAEKELSPSFSGEEIQGACWQVESVYFYCKAICELRMTLEQEGWGGRLKSQGLKELDAFLERLLEEENFSKMKRQAYEIWEEICGLKLTLEITGNKVSISPKEQGGEYEEFLQDVFGKYGEVQKGSMHSPYSGVLFLSRLEKSLLQAFWGKYPELEKKILEFADTYQEYKNEWIVRLESEVQFYLAYYRFQMEMTELGARFCRPSMNKDLPMRAEEVYDLALSCVNLPLEKEVVSNDFIYDAKEQFFVVNGPNQGGKTTFARSLGQMVYWAKMGLEVNAKVANVYYFDKLVTHFSVEESMESGHGKLMEELNRLAPVMKKDCENSFVIINELFTTAAHYDGCIMGARVLQFFMDRKCHGVYVTHLRALGDDSEGVVRMSAMLDGTDSRRRTYKISRCNVEIKGYAQDIVEKYQLTYESLRTDLERYTKATD